MSPPDEVDTEVTLPKRRGTPLHIQVQQVLVAIAAAAVVSRLAWAHVGNQLSVTTDIVGSTTFNNFDIYRYFDHFLILVLLFPGLALALYLADSRWGPLANRGPRPPWPPPLVVADPPAAEASGVPEPTLRAAGVVGAALRVGLPAFVVAVEVSVGRSTQAQSLDLPTGVAAGVAYGAAVALVTAALRMWLGRDVAWRDLLATVNAALAVAVLPLLLLVSASTAVSIASTNRVVSYPWLPVWLPVVATVAVVACMGIGFHRRGWAAARRTERMLLVGLMGPLILFFLTGSLVGAEGRYAGFDDAQRMVGAHLMFDDGLWPWRDIYLLHGFFDDGLFGQLGMWSFGRTRWASDAGFALFVVPLTVAGLYFFIVYFARRNYALLVAGCVALSLGLMHIWYGSRYVLMPLVIVLFDRILRRGSWSRAWALMAMIVLTSIVAPESTLLVLGVLGTLVAAELVHHDWRLPLRDGLRRTTRCAVTGGALTAAWLVFLAATGSLAGFVNYYLANARGSELWGTLPIHWPLPGDFAASLMFALPIALFLLTAAKVAWKLQRRSPWRTSEWSLVASATAVPLFYHLALHRFDAGHVGEVFLAMVPFVVLWAGELVTMADTVAKRAVTWAIVRRIRSRFTGLVAPAPRPWPWIATTPAALAAVVVVLALSPLSATDVVANVAAHFHPGVPAEPPSGIPLGYTVPGSVDITQIEDLRTVIDRYAPPGQPVFEFVNEMGVVYFLLDRVPGAHFYHVEAAQTGAAQREEVADLTRSRPPVVIFNDTTFGLPDYDNIWSMERNYLVSQYLLDNYQPLADVEGQLVMLRNDLAGTAPPLPALQKPPRTTGLYFADQPACDWGDVPAFLQPPNLDESASGVAVTSASGGNATTALGWAFDKPADKPPLAVLALADGRVLATTSAFSDRPDVAAYLHDPAASSSGWALSAVAPPGRPVHFYALNADQTVTPLDEAGTGAPSKVTVNSRSYAVVDRAGTHNVESVNVLPMMNLSVPATTRLTDYKWLEFDSPTGFAESTIRVSDQTDWTDLTHVMAFNTLPRVGRTVYLRVGSCIQWHGYRTGDLHMLLDGAPSDISVRLVP